MEKTSRAWKCPTTAFLDRLPIKGETSLTAGKHLLAFLQPPLSGALSYFRSARLLTTSWDFNGKLLRYFVDRSRDKAEIEASSTAYLVAGAEPDIFIWGATGGASFATRRAVNGLCKTFRKRPTPVAWRHAENFGGATGGPGKIWGGQWPPLAPPSSAPA